MSSVVRRGRTGALGRLAAVLGREMRSLGRGRGGFLLRVLYAALLLAIVWFQVDVLYGWESAAKGSNPAIAGPELAQLAAKLFQVLTVAQGFGGLLLGTVLGLTSTLGERREKTLGLLVLSPLRTAEILGGKLLALLALLTTVLVAPLPLFAVLGWAGGMDYLWLGAHALSVLALVALGLALGSWAGLRAPGAGSAVLLGMAGLTALLSLPVWLPVQAPALRATILDLHPVKALLTAARQGLGGTPFLDPLLVTWGLTALFVGAAWRQVPRAPARHGRSLLRHWFIRLDVLFERINPGDLRLTRLESGRRPRGNPVTWLAHTSGGFGLPAHIVRLTAAAIVLWLLVVPLFADSRWREPVYLLVATALCLAALAAGAAALAGERSRRSFEVLAASPLTGATIVTGKTRIWARLCLLLLPLLVAGFFVTLAVDGARGEQVGWSLCFGLLLLSTAACAYSLALALSLFSSSPLRAGVGGLFLLGATPTVSGLVATFLWTAWRRGQATWLTATATVLLLVAGGMLFMTRGWTRKNPALSLAGLLTGLLCAVGVTGAWPLAESTSLLDVYALRLGELLVDLDLSRSWSQKEKGTVLLIGTHLSLVAGVVWLWSVVSFDRAVGRAP